MSRLLRRLLVLIVVLAVPVYAVSVLETLAIPRQWRAIAVGDSHAQVRARLRASGLADQQCEWFDAALLTRCTLVGRHHAAGMSIRFDGVDAAARVSGVQIHGPVYTGPFHIHARLKHAVAPAVSTGPGP